MRDCFLLLV